ARRTSRERRRGGPAVCRGALLPIGGLDEAGEERMRLERTRLELGMELHRDEPRMARQFRDLHELAVGRPPGDLHAVLGERAFVETVELEAVAGPLMHDVGAIDAPGEGPGRQGAGIAAE